MVVDAIASHGHQLPNICVWFNHVSHLVAREMLFDNKCLEISRGLSLQFPFVSNKEIVWFCFLFSILIVKHVMSYC